MYQAPNGLLGDRGTRIDHDVLHSLPARVRAPTITAAEIAPCFSCSMAAAASRLRGSTLRPSALNSAAAVTAEADPAGPKFTCRPDRPATPPISARARTWT